MQRHERLSAPFVGLFGRCLCGELLFGLVGAQVLFAPQLQAAAPAPRVIVSTRSATLRLVGGRLRPDAPRIFPVGIGRGDPSGDSAPRGIWFTGPDHHDKNFFNPRREIPAYHRGGPSIRLLRVPLRLGATGAAYRRATLETGSIHGPVTPSLIWGNVSAGCIRLRSEDLRRVYAFLSRYPRAPISYEATSQPMPQGSYAGSCPEAKAGVRPLQRLALETPHADRICGVDHWYGVSLQGGDYVSIRLEHAGALRVELYGIKAISAIAEGSHGLLHRLPNAKRSRGLRYVRVVARGTGGKTTPYVLEVQRLR